jgi:Fatty acid hydroxylase superfamily
MQSTYQTMPDLALGRRADPAGTLLRYRRGMGEAAAARARLRRGIGPRYSGLLHFAFTSTVALAVIGFALSRLRSPSALQLLTVPATFLYANFVEWRAHRGPMHRKTRGLSLIHERHALQHHAFFTAAEMQIDSRRDFKMVLFPPVLIVFFFGLFAVPVGFALRLAFGGNVAALFVATSMGYFLLYEWLHLAYHLPVPLPGIEKLRIHHRTHHDPRLMTRTNFNITFPICDAIFGTRAA